MASPLAKKAEAAGLTTTMIRSLSQGVMVKKFGLEAPEAAELKKCVARQPIDADAVDVLLARGNQLCCVCKGQKGDGVIVHHIVEYRAVPRITDTPTSRSFAPTTTIAPTMAG